MVISFLSATNSMVSWQSSQNYYCILLGALYLGLAYFASYSLKFLKVLFFSNFSGMNYDVRMSHAFTYAEEVDRNAVPFS